MRNLIVLVILLVVSACNSKDKQQEPFLSLLKPCTEVNMVLYNGGNPLNFKTTDSSGLKILTGMITGDNENVKDTCMPMGELYFINNADSVLKAQFSAKQTGKEATCSYVAYTFNGTSYKHKLSEKGQLLLSQLGQTP
ncbi:MAG TPA: hypothetical protein VM935_11535 [Chitinophagaceae bacterium]|nr:hypothetical protein [Chitinophagaceae bacterium]